MTNVGILDWLFPKKKIVTVQLDKVGEGTANKALVFQQAELKAKNANLEKELAQLRKREEDEKEELIVKTTLNQKQKELRIANQGTYFSMRSFWSKYLKDKKFRHQLGFYTWDRNKKLGGFGDIGIAKNGDFILFDDKGMKLIQLPELKDIFQSVSALGNDISTGKIPINLDEEGGYIENIMITEMAEVTQAEDGRLQYKKARKKPLYELVKQLRGEISQARSDLEEAEGLNVELQNKIDAFESRLRVNENMAETSRAEVRLVEDRAIGIDKVFRRTTRDLISVRNSHLMEEDYVDQLQRELMTIRQKAEREGVKIPDERALELIQRIRSTLVNELPDEQRMPMPAIDAPTQTGQQVPQK